MKLFLRDYISLVVMIVITIDCHFDCVLAGYRHVLTALYSVF